MHGLVDGPAGLVRERDEHAVRLAHDPVCLPELDDRDLLCVHVWVQQDLPVCGTRCQLAAIASRAARMRGKTHLVRRGLDLRGGKKDLQLGHAEGQQNASARTRNGP